MVPLERGSTSDVQSNLTDEEMLHCINAPHHKTPLPYPRRSQIAIDKLVEKGVYREYYFKRGVTTGARDVCLPHG
jgi:hypothetical protein